MKLTIEIDEMGGDGNLPPWVVAVFRKLMAKLPQQKTEKGAPAKDDPPRKKFEELDRKAEVKRRGKHPSMEKIVPCRGNCGRHVKWRGFGWTPKCPFCGGKGIIVGDNPSQTSLPPLLTEKFAIVDPNPQTRIENPTLEQKICEECKDPLILRYGKWFCAKCNAYKGDIK